MSILWSSLFSLVWLHYNIPDHHVGVDSATLLSFDLKLCTFSFHDMERKVLEIQQENQILYAFSFLLFFIFPFPYNSLCEHLKKLPDCFGLKIIRREAAHEYHRFNVNHGFFHWASSNANLVVHSSTEARLNLKCWLKAQVTTCWCYIYTNYCCTQFVTQYHIHTLLRIC